VDLEDVLLVSFADQAPEELADRLLGDCERDLRRAIERARRQGLPAGLVPLPHCSRFVSWSLITQARKEKAGAERAEREGQIAEPSRPFRDVWRKRTAEHGASGGSILSDCVWSLACEQRAEWRVEGSDQGVAYECFESVYTRESGAVLALQRQRRNLLVPAADACETAWGDAWATYWSEGATARFGGHCRIRTLLGTISLRAALPSPRSRHELGLEDREPPVSEPVDARMATEELERAWRECLQLLPPVRRCVAELFFVRKMRHSEIAEQIGSGRPNITNHLERGKEDLRKCLSGKGFGEDSWNPED